ncbi:bifunctional methylenetetrahydrofolate dehydrogenase/methenyltetrahydrofolate cyclohydrolase FolD [Alicyclobacillus sp.]|uniref:bifunctional methylenetetrahydrofolate dehydrogenase/methenyltetrahydrofolate cyclohydrolase FolD n=1 Tax=Alicyclobacillus sp. TaxID=61169 RepID=UPI0025BB54C1|nr:bifunctional methylenetetrahydrofolate dehydrogenase/methenyltetrahydrofolate cyclohydrolase FolD [Alicyclobacillus sp.]MCL6516203.1 bifunctional methylenetetrahydrofolate dehydrogenase/methenyltetrahydrofolate cyclohydrolase FolD [Alicyclobacillus sp.]
MAEILDGKRVAQALHERVEAQLRRVAGRGRLKLSVVLVGDHPASASYVRGKQRTAEKLGLDGEVHHLPESVTEPELLGLIDRLNADPQVDGILVQLPLPPHIDERTVIERIAPEKDVDGFHPLNVGRNLAGVPAVWPCTPAGIMAMLDFYGISVAGQHAVVVGRSNIVGKPMAQMLLQADATVTVCHRKTQSLTEYTRRADILVVAAGVPGLIRGDDIKPGAVVVDVGIHRVNGTITGDVAFDEAARVARAITPVPGGVGPLTVAMLMVNTVRLGLRRRGWGGDVL